MRLARIKERGIRDANDHKGSRFASAMEIKSKDVNKLLNENKNFDMNSKKNTSQPSL